MSPHSINSYSAILVHYRKAHLIKQATFVPCLTNVSPTSRMLGQHEEDIEPASRPHCVHANRLPVSLMILAYRFLPELWPFVSFSHFINRSFCLRNYSYSFQGILMKLSSYCSHDLKMVIFYRGHAQLIFIRIMAL